MKTVLSVRDFAILYNMVSNRIECAQRLPHFWERSKEQEESARKKHLEMLEKDIVYQDLLRIREQLGKLQIEIETPNVEVKE